MNMYLIEKGDLTIKECKQTNNKHVEKYIRKYTITYKAAIN